mmetsp:Transcript_52111/g.97485  ORF Transcript_52111/g.97485 Transcript_52111/m.97485 type:complete len:206 (-) Transcript_52111:147-764(-)
MPVDSGGSQPERPAFERPGGAYSPFDVEARCDVPNLPESWTSGWLGRILVYNFAGHLLFIGPHWYCSVLMFGFIVAVGLFHCSSVSSPTQMAAGVLVTVLSASSFIRCALSDPGVLPKSADESLAESLAPAAPRVKRCEICQVVQPRGCQHCHFCQVCIQGLDHHCPWMGKCIGKKNLCSFYTFLFVGFSSLAYILLVALMQPPE